MGKQSPIIILVEYYFGGFDFEGNVIFWVHFILYQMTKSSFWIICDSWLKQWILWALMWSQYQIFDFDVVDLGIVSVVPKSAAFNHFVLAFCDLCEYTFLAFENSMVYHWVILSVFEGIKKNDIMNELYPSFGKCWMRNLICDFICLPDLSFSPLIIYTLFKFINHLSSSHDLCSITLNICW